MNYLDFFGSRRTKPIYANTYIGGIAATINTKTLLASYIQTTESNIDLFEIDNNNNIRFALINQYTFMNTFGHEGGLSFIYDFDGKIIFGNTVTSSNPSTLTFTRVIANNEFTFNTQDFRLQPLTHVILPNVNGLPNGTFGQQRGVLKRVYIPSWNPSVDNGNLGGSYSEISKHAVWYFHPDRETSNNGSIDARIQSTVLDQGGTAEARFIQNTDKPNPVTDLTVSNITTNSAQLNFTSPPVNTNANDFYYVYLDWNGISFKFKYSERHEISAFYDEITGSGDTITGLPSGTQISVQVQTVDFYHNVSSYSNKVTFTTL